MTSWERLSSKQKSIHFTREKYFQIRVSRKSTKSEIIWFILTPNTSLSEQILFFKAPPLRGPVSFFSHFFSYNPHFSLPFWSYLWKGFFCNDVKFSEILVLIPKFRFWPGMLSIIFLAPTHIYIIWKSQLARSKYSWEERKFLWKIL